MDKQAHVYRSHGDTYGHWRYVRGDQDRETKALIIPWESVLCRHDSSWQFHCQTFHRSARGWTGKKEKEIRKHSFKSFKSQTVALTSKTMKEHESEGRDACINLSHETNCRLKLIYSSSKCRLRANTIQLFICTIPDYICRFSYTSASLKNRPYTLQINVLSSQLLKIATRGAPSHTANNGINMWHAVHYFWGGTTAEAVTQQWFHFRAIATVDPRGNFSKGNQTCFTHPQELS